MSDIRFIMIGVLLVFFGFIILGVFGEKYQTPNIETREFGNCFEYFEDKEPVPVDCSDKIFQQGIFFGIVIALNIGGVIALVKGVRGDWDSKVKPEDMVGPSKDNRVNGTDSD
ncbi:MAG: hypothetical protein OEQ12_05835 [Nitrosopumilus sp.]|nr:hypothetical protein [Nitrosopumilus sp.]